MTSKRDVIVAAVTVGLVAAAAGHVIHHSAGVGVRRGTTSATVEAVVPACVDVEEALAVLQSGASTYARHVEPNWTAEDGQRSAGRPQKTWRVTFAEDLQGMERSRDGDRKRWKNLVTRFTARQTRQDSPVCVVLGVAV